MMESLPEINCDQEILNSAIVIAPQKIRRFGVNPRQINTYKKEILFDFLIKKSYYGINAESFDKLSLVESNLTLVNKL